MMIPPIGPAATARGTRSSSPRTDALALVAERGDVVDISQAARDLLAAGELAVSRPAAMLSGEQVQVKMGLLRAFMEALFGRKESEERSPEQEIAAAVLEKPATQAAIQTMRSNGWAI